MDAIASMGSAGGRLNSLWNIAAAGEGFEERRQRGRLPAGGRNKRAVEKGALSISQRSPIGSVDQTPSSQQDRVARRRVPFAGRRCPRVDVGLPLGDKAEFERRP